MIEVAIFARYPCLGKVKTRLAQAIGADLALACYTSLLDVAISATAEYSPTIWLEGASSDLTIDLPYPVQQQPSGNLGQKMYFVLAQGAQIIVGSDIPNLTGEILGQAVRKLAAYDLVLGPAEDGGYYLIGMIHPRQEIFENISWGTELVLEETLARAASINFSVGLLPQLWDVDRAADYRRWVAASKS